MGDFGTPRLPAAQDTHSRRRSAGLGLMFGMIAFFQGVAEPTAGLIAQPVQAIRWSGSRSSWG